MKKHDTCTECGECDHDDCKEESLEEKIRRLGGVGIMSLPGTKKGHSHLISLNLFEFGHPDFIIFDVPTLFSVTAVELIRDLAESIFPDGPETELLCPVKEGDTIFFNEMFPLKFEKLTEDQKEILLQFREPFPLPELLVVSLDQGLYDQKKKEEAQEDNTSSVSVSLEC